MFKNYSLAVGFAIFALSLAGLWGIHSGMGLLGAVSLTALLAVLEISLSFDNAVVNATVLKTMNPLWQKVFLTLGVLVAVFGMRLLFPVLVVSVTSGLGVSSVVDMALHDAHRYGEVLTAAYPMIATFGGAFLLLVFLDFAFDDERDVHWLGLFERKLASLGVLEGIEITVALLAVTVTALCVAPELQFKVLLSGVAGVVLHAVINALDGLFEQEEEGSGAVGAVVRNGLMGFIYLEVLDASFSFDGVIGAFAVTRDVVLIMLGLGIGAMFVRSLTVDLVRRGTLDEYVYLEHGAMYAIGVLAVILLVGTQVHIPQVVTGLVGAGLIGAAFLSSLFARSKESTASE